MLHISPWPHIFTHEDKQVVGLQERSLISLSSVRWPSTYLSLFTEISRYRAPAKVSHHASPDFVLPPLNGDSVPSHIAELPSASPTCENAAASLSGRACCLHVLSIVGLKLFLILSIQIVAFFKFHWQLSTPYGPLFLQFSLGFRREEGRNGFNLPFLSGSLQIVSELSHIAKRQLLGNNLITHLKLVTELSLELS